MELAEEEEVWLRKKKEVCGEGAIASVLERLHLILSWQSGRLQHWPWCWLLWDAMAAAGCRVGAPYALLTRAAALELERVGCGN